MGLFRIPQLRPSRICFKPLPTLLGGLHTTSMDSMVFGLRICSAWRASKEAILNSSEPQNRMRRGSQDFEVEYLLQMTAWTRKHTLWLATPSRVVRSMFTMEQRNISIEGNEKKADLQSRSDLPLKGPVSRSSNSLELLT